MGTIRRVCAWCGVEMGEKVIPNALDQPITHGICENCLVTLWGDVGTPLEAFLESLEIPTLLVNGTVAKDEHGAAVVDGAVAVDRANKDALGMLGRSQGKVEGMPLGDVFDCINALLPGGCGRTIHCSGCTLRNTVTRTFTTGESQIRVPATLKVSPQGVTEEIAFHVTTEKVGDRVLVQIEPARN